MRVTAGPSISRKVGTSREVRSVLRAAAADAACYYDPSLTLGADQVENLGSSIA